MGQGLLDDVFSGSEGVAKTLLNTFGGSGVLTTPGEETYNPITGEETAGASSSWDVDVSAPQNYSADEIDGSAIQRGDCHVQIPACDVSEEPVAGKSTLTIGSTVWTVVSVNPVYSGAEVAVYELQLRR
jgi:hypothetical protein